MPFIDTLFTYIKNPTFLETGTYQGDTIYRIVNSSACNPSCIISLELSDVFFNRCTERFADNSRVKIYKGNSKYDLYDIIKNIETPITFWLDSHWSGTQDVGCDAVTVCPIIEELEQIQKHSIKTHTIMIDDIRLMNSSTDRSSGFPVKLEEILSKLYKINPAYTIQYYDDFTSNNDILVAYIKEA